MFDFPQLISKRLTSPDFWSHQKYCNDYSPLRLRLLQTHQSQQTSLPTNAAVPRWADLMLTILQILLRQWRTWNHLWLSPQLNSSLALSLTFILLIFLFQVSQLRDSPLLTSPTAAATEPVKPADKSAKKRSSSKVSRFSIENFSTLSKIMTAL